MAPSTNPKVKQAYRNGTYTDLKGNEWRRGMDGWFLDDGAGPGTTLLSRHDEFVEFIEKEHPIGEAK